MRKPVTKTYDISIEMYSLLFRCCEEYYDNLAWKYPAQCPDKLGYCGIDHEKFLLNLRYEIPTLYRDDCDRIAVPTIHDHTFNDDTQPEYDQFALLDLVEFFAQNIHDVDVIKYHEFWKHHHLKFQDSQNIRTQFRDKINEIFQKTGLLYELKTNLQVERIIENSPLTPDIESAFNALKEDGIRKLLQEAICLHRSPCPENIRDATEKLWDAFERLKSYYTKMDKRNSATKIVSDMSAGQTDYIELFNTEFKELSRIGNNFRIRHHETNKVEISDDRYYDYFFNRCLSLIALAIQYLE